MDLVLAEVARWGVAGSAVAALVLLAAVWLLIRLTRRVIAWPVVFGVLALVAVFGAFGSGFGGGW